MNDDIPDGLNPYVWGLLIIGAFVAVVLILA